MGEYIGQVPHQNSVKPLHLLEEPTDQNPGKGDFRFLPVFSVFDYGTIEPPVPLDNSTICLMGGYNFELLKREGILTHYFGLVDSQGREMSVKEALEETPPTSMRINVVNRIVPEFDGEWDYSMFENPEVNNYVQPIEFISRLEIPQESSVWKRVERGEVTFEDLGLPENFKPGDKLPGTTLDYSTKFEPEDRYITPEQARQMMRIDQKRFDKINQTTREASDLMTSHAELKGFQRLDGKVEYVSMHGIDMLGDVVCTWHEDRLIGPGGTGISKQRIRDRIKKDNPEWYEDIERAKEEAREEGVEDWRTLLNPDIEVVLPAPEFFEGINDLFRAATNLWVGARVYPVNVEDTLEGALLRAEEDFRRVA